MFSWTGKEIGDFVIEEPIGRGGTAAVYAARQRSVERKVALKIIDLQASDGDFLKRFTREAEVIAMLEHIHILPIYGYGVLEGEYAFLAMRLLETGTLADVLRRGALPLDAAIDLFTQIASGLHYMHSQGIVHRDLKPGNILLDAEGNAYLSDFGLARMMGGTHSRANDSMLAGSPAYIAPEVIQGESADHLSDIYSLGVILYQMLAGRPPFESEDSGLSGNLSALLYKHMHEKPPPPHQFNPAITPEVESVILRALSKNPRARFASAEDMAYELRAAAALSSMSLLRVPPMLAAQRVRRRLAPLPRLALVMAVVTVMTIVTGYLLLRSRTPGPPMNVLTGQRAGLGSLTIADSEIDVARGRLGDDGFIAYFPCTLSDVYQKTLENRVSDLAHSYDLNVRIYDSQDDPAREITLVEQARIEGAKAFILCPLGEPLLDSTILSLQEATIPLVLSFNYDLPYGIKIDLDSRAIGIEQGRYAGLLLQAEHSGTGTVVLTTMANTAIGRDRAEGMIAGLRETAPQAHVIGPVDGYTSAQAAESIHNLLTDGTHFDAVLTMTDGAALGVIDALKAASLSPNDVFIVSANGDSPMSAYIRDGHYVRGTVAIDPNEQGQLAIIGIVKALAGSPVPEYLTLDTGALMAAPSPAPTPGASAQPG